MELTVEAINILFFLIPGFISSVILGAIVVRRELSVAEKLVEGLILSFINYSIITIFVQIEPFAYLIKGRDTLSFSFTQNIYFLLILLSVSVFVALTLGAVLFHDLHMQLLRFLKITKNTSRDTTWQDIFIEMNQYLVVTFKDGKRLYGWPLYYSDSHKDGLLYLSDPAWIDDDGNYNDCKTHGILIKYADLELIEVMNNEGEQG